MLALYRIIASVPITPFEVRLAALVALEWWLMDHFWMLATFNHWFGL